jgi:nitrate reductase (cytochrome), electron transfer subunit
MRSARARLGLVVVVASCGALGWLLLAAANDALVRHLDAASERESAAARFAGGSVPGITRTPGITRAIAAEALVFSMRPDAATLEAQAYRRPDAHPRTLAMFQALRAYPGAPPRVPHGLTPDEFRGTVCSTCHERGGYSPRFGAYVPIVPHPELTSCLQCHATDVALVGVALPDPRGDALCHQCHSAARTDDADHGTDWQPAPWPRVSGGAADGTPPEIPHDLQLRGNCLACHMGPAAVAEIRTSHPERSNCRQCHLALQTISSGAEQRP